MGVGVTDIDTALGLIEAVRIIRSRVRSMAREDDPRRKEWRAAYEARHKEKRIAAERKRDRTGRRAGERARRIAAIFAARRYEDQPGVR